MTLGRTSAGKIKIKTDGGLRAVECACCGCTGMFKILGVDIQIPKLPISFPPITSPQGPPWYPVYSPLGQITSNFGIAGSTGALDINVFLDSPSPLNRLPISMFNPPCNSSTSYFYSDYFEVTMSLPISLYAQGIDGVCVNLDTGERTPYEFSGYIPTAFSNCGSNEEWDYGNSEYSIVSQGSDPPNNFACVNGNLNFENSEGSVYGDGTAEFYFDFFDGLTLTNLDNGPAFSANPYGGPFPFIPFNPSEGTSLFPTFQGFNRTTPSDYELTWPLLKAPYIFTIPAP